MAKSDTGLAQPVGLDVGTSRIVVARSAGEKHAYDRQLNAFVSLPYSKLTEGLLAKDHVVYDVEGAEILICGDEAQRFAEIFQVDIRRPMAKGVLNPGEPHNLNMVRQILARLVGRAIRQGQEIVFSVPCRGAGLEDAVDYHEACIRQILTGLGYSPTPIEEGLATVFGELADSSFTGIGVSCGSGLCNVCVAALSVPVLSFSVPKAGDFIDTQAALVTGERTNRLRVQKESGFRLTGLNGDRIQNALSVYYEKMIANLVEALRTTLTSSQCLPRFEKPVPLVLCGGSVLPEGFLERFIEALRPKDFPIRLSEVRLSEDPLNSTARGALIAAVC